MAKTISCPQIPELEKLASGELPPQRVELLVQHLEACETCFDKVRTLSSTDTFMEAMVKAKPVAERAEEEQVARLIDKLTAAGRGAPRRANPLTVACIDCHVSMSVDEQSTLAYRTLGNEQSANATASLPADMPSPELYEFLAPAEMADEIGRLGPYRILKVLGAGGMGVVFQAEDPKLERMLAIKAMLPTLAVSETARQRFLREAKTAAAIEHDHIVPIFQVGEDRGVPFMAMPLLKGEPLDKRLDQDSVLPVAEVLHVGREAAKGMAAAHAVGLVHRDIKPANLWLETIPRESRGSAPGFRVKILDFGLARAAAGNAQLTQQERKPFQLDSAGERATAGDAQLTQQGAIVGTPAYMAPEQAAGQAVDARCDLFSLGCVLYRMCTGQLPFKGADTVSTLMAVALEDPPPPKDLRPDLPPALSDLVMRLLAKNPAERPQSAEAVAKALQGIDGETASLTSRSLNKPRKDRRDDTAKAVRTPRPSGKRRLPLAWVVAAGVFFLTVGVAVTAAITAYWQTPYGLVKIESDDPGIEIVIDKTGPTIKGADKEPIKLRAGEHGLLVKRGDFTFETDKLLVKKGETSALKIELLPGQARIVLDGRVIAERVLPPAKTSTNGGSVIAAGKAQASPAVVNAEQGVLDFAEIHDAADMRFDEWIARMEKTGYRPVSISVRVDKGSPRIMAAAVLEEKKQTWKFIRVEQDGGAAYRLNVGLWAKGFFTYAHCTYLVEGTIMEAGLWMPGKRNIRQAGWSGSAEFAADKLDKAHRLGERLWYRTVVVRDGIPRHTFSLIADDPIPWKERTGQSSAAMREWIEQRRADGWRPEHLHVYGNKADTRFGGILLKEPNKTDWSVSWSLTPAQYEAELLARKKQGFRPHSPIAHDDDDGSLRISVIWIRYRDPAAAAPLSPRFTNNLGMAFALVPKGKSWLGGTGGKPGQREVNITRDFYLGVYEVTQEEWRKVMGKNPSYFSRAGEGKEAVKDILDADLERFPVDSVSWDDCQDFVSRLNEKAKEPGWLYRLPTEVEWEYACRGGPLADQSAGAFDYYFEKPTNELRPELANFWHAKGSNRPCKVGSYPPNRLGFHDMHGNVGECCLDESGGGGHMGRGGSWHTASNSCQARFRGNRLQIPKRWRGLRVARVPAEAANSK